MRTSNTYSKMDWLHRSLYTRVQPKICQPQETINEVEK